MSKLLFGIFLYRCWQSIDHIHSNYSTGQGLELEREKLLFGLYLIIFRLLRIELSKSKHYMEINFSFFFLKTNTTKISQY